ncbi:MAG: hypothetical protein AAB036_06760 [Elusimicrobiota bacterium]
MKYDRCASALCLLLGLVTSVSASAVLTLESPPGWSDAAIAGKDNGILIALKGPETSSFVVKRAREVALDNPAVVRGYLQDVLKGINKVGQSDYRGDGRVETVTFFRNGLSAHVMRARLRGEERMILGVFEVGTQAHLAVLISAAPGAMLAPLLGAIDLGSGANALRETGTVRSEDAQLEVALGGGLQSRPLLEAELAKGFVLAIRGAGSEILFQKLSNAEATNPQKQSATLRDLAAAAAGRQAASPLLSAPTAAGPVGVYSWAKVGDDSSQRVVAGYLPWCYWGYQIFGRGSAADDFLVGVLAALKAGPGASPALVAGSPRVPLSRGFEPGLLFWGAIIVAAIGVILLLWSWRQKNANLGG